MTITITIQDGLSTTALTFDREVEDGEVFFVIRNWGKLSPKVRELADTLAEKLTEIDTLREIEVEPVALSRPKESVQRVDWINRFRESAQSCNLDLGPAIEGPKEIKEVVHGS